MLFKVFPQTVIDPFPVTGCSPAHIPELFYAIQTRFKRDSNAIQTGCEFAVGIVAGVQEYQRSRKREGTVKGTYINMDSTGIGKEQ